MIGSFLGCRMKGKRATRRGLRSVTMKRNRRAVTVWLMVGAPAPLATRCS